MKFEPHIPYPFYSIKTYVSNGSRKEQIKWVFQLSPLRGVIILSFMDAGMLKLFTTKIVEV